MVTLRKSVRRHAMFMAGIALMLLLPATGLGALAAMATTVPERTPSAPAIAQAVATTTIAATDHYAYSTHQTYSYKVVMPNGATMRNIHVGLPQFATLASNSTISSPNYPTGHALKYGVYYDFYPAKPTMVGAGWTLYFTITGAINPRPSTVSALIEAWNSAGTKFTSFRTGASAFALAPLPTYPAVRSYPVADHLCTPDPYSIAAENALPGGTGWQLTAPVNPSAPEITAYPDRSSALCGQTFGMHVSVTDGSSTFTTEVWRYGWYGGDMGRLITTLGPTPAGVQAGGVLRTLERPSNSLTPSLQTPRIATAANNWATTFNVTVPPTWTPGAYLFKFTSAKGRESYAPFVVRDDYSTSTYEMALGFLTYQAYNTWGGASLYLGVSGLDYDQAVVASFDRPLGGVGKASDGNFLHQDARLIADLERRGLPTSYIADVDLANSAAHLNQHKTLILGPHSEYWNTTMRANVDGRVKAGMNLLNFGANQAWGQVDLPPGRPSGYPQRSIHTSRSCSPDRTGYFHDVANGCYGSSQALFGVQYNCWGVAGDAVVGNNWLWAGTGLAPGAKVQNLLGGHTGTETDVVGKGQPTPAGLTVLSHSPLSLCRNTAAGTAGMYSDMVYYRNSAGGQVFSAGTQNWVCFLDVSCAPSGSAGVNAVSKMMSNLLARFASTGPPPGPAATTVERQYLALPKTSPPRAIAPYRICKTGEGPQLNNCIFAESDGD
ncbi:MAG: N,N-dimethylformamidase beta subunit family domain-containing protein [Mycobacteriales bacterium]